MAGLLLLLPAPARPEEHPRAPRRMAERQTVELGAPVATPDFHFGEEAGLSFNDEPMCGRGLAHTHNSAFLTEQRISEQNRTAHFVRSSRTPLGTGRPSQHFVSFSCKP